MIYSLSLCRCISNIRGCLQLKRLCTTMISFRRATVDDYEGVCNVIGDAYVGDPLFCREMFHFLLTRQHNLASVAVLKKKLVGFGMCMIVDEGKTFYSCFSRVKPELQNLGISKNIKFYLMQQVRPWERGIEEFLYLNDFSGPMPAQRRNAVCIGKNALSFCEFLHSSEIRKYINLFSVGSSIQEIVEKNQIQEIISAQKFAFDLYGSDRIIIGLVPYKMFPGNVDLILENEDPHIMAEIQNGYYLSVSYCVIHGQRLPNRICVRVAVFTKDPVSVIDHCYQQLKFAVEKHHNVDIMLEVLMDKIFHKGSQEREFVEEQISKTTGLMFVGQPPDLHTVLFKRKDFEYKVPEQIYIDESELEKLR